MTGLVLVALKSDEVQYSIFWRKMNLTGLMALQSEFDLFRNTALSYSLIREFKILVPYRKKRKKSLQTAVGNATKNG
jgi:hypothetical protein